MIFHLQILLLAMIAGATYSVIWWLSKKFDPSKKTEKFSVTKFLITLCFGAAVGLIFIYGQIPISDIWDGFQFLIYAASTAVLKETTQTVYRKAKK